MTDSLSEVAGHAHVVAATVQHSAIAAVIHRLVEQVVDPGGHIAEGDNMN